MNKKIGIYLVVILIILIGIVIGYRVYMDRDTQANNLVLNNQREETISENSNSVDVNDYYAEEDLTVVQTGEERNINL